MDTQFSIPPAQLESALFQTLRLAWHIPRDKDTEVKLTILPYSIQLTSALFRPRDQVAIFLDGHFPLRTLRCQQSFVFA